LISELGNRGLKDGKVSLQEVLTKVTREARNEPPLSQMWSTMSRKLDFPKCKDIYIPHSIRELGETDPEKYLKFDECIEGLISCENDLVLVSASPGMGKSRASEELHSQLVVRMNSHFVIHQKLSRTISYWNTEFLEKREPTVESFLMSCVDSRKGDYLKSQLNLEKVFLILDGFDEICPSHREEVLKMIQDLIDRKVKLLVTSRPQEKDKILNGLKNAKIRSFELDKFNNDEQVLMLQTRLNLSKNDCKSILDNFYESIWGFSSNPLHLQMICDLYETDRDTLSNFNIYEVYEKFLKKKLKHGLLTCGQMDVGNKKFVTEMCRIENILTKSAISLVLRNVHPDAQTKGDDFVAINMSGVATIVEENGEIDFVHRSYAEHLVAQKILQLCFSADESESDETSKVVKLLCESSENTRMFVEKGILQFSDQDLNQRVKLDLKNNWKQVLRSIFTENLHEMYTNLIETPFGETQVAEWLKISQDEAYEQRSGWRKFFGLKRDERGLFVLACRHDKMAEKLVDLCSSLKVRNVYEVVKFIAEKNKSPVALKSLLSKIQGWEENLCKTIAFEYFIKDCNNLSSDQLKLLINSKLAQTLVKKMHSLDLSNTKVSLELLPVLLENGLELTVEKNGFTLVNVFLVKKINKDGDKGANLLFEFATKVTDHFEKAEDFDSEKSLMYRKNLGANSPEELGLDHFSNIGKRKYCEHIDECASRLFDGGRCCEYNYYSRGSHRVKPVSERNLKIDVAFLLHQLRIIQMDPDGVILSYFLSVVDKIPRDFKFKCGCSLAHTRFARQNVAMLKLLKEKGFNLMEKNKFGKTPLHFKHGRNDFFEFLLQNILRDDFVSLEEDREFPARSGKKQMEIERILCVKDNEGKMAIHYAAKSEDGRNLEVLVKNLLGNLFVSEDGTSAVSARTEEQQKIVERILLAQDEKGKTPLHLAKYSSHFKILLTNWLYSVDEACNWEKQKEIASMLKLKDSSGKSLLDLIVQYGFFYSKTYTLSPFIRNLLRD